MKRRFALILASGLLMATAVLVPHLALAVGARSGDNVTLAKADTHHGTLYAAGQTVMVDGTVDGDLFCAGNTVVINGNVTGDVICAGQTLTINGQVGGNVRAAGQTIMVNGSVARNISAAGQSFTLSKDARVSGEVALLSQTTQINGPVARDLYGAISSLSLSSTVGGSLNAQAESLSLGSGAHITGDLDYTSPKTFQIDAAQVAGHINRHEPEHKAVESPRTTAMSWISDRLYWIMATLAIALVLAWLAPAGIRRATDLMTTRAGASIGFGLLAMFVAPLALILLFITIVGVPLALMLGALWLVALGLAGTFVSLAIGRWILARSDWNKTSLPLAALVGVPTTMVIFGLPFVGWVFALVTSWWVLGSFILGCQTNHASSTKTKTKTA